VDSDIPSYKGTFTIEEAWSDSEGNIWIVSQRMGALIKNVLIKISNSVTVIEFKPYNGGELPDMEGKTFPYIQYRQ
jgi:hypothetical protein